jgi:hypothetical protein
MAVKPAEARMRARRNGAEAVAGGATPVDGEPATTIVTGLQEAGAEVTAYAEHTLDQAMNFVRSLIDAGSLGDVMALQQKFAQENFARLIAGSARVTGIGLRTGAILIGSAPAAGGRRFGT